MSEETGRHPTDVEAGLITAEQKALSSDQGDCGDAEFTGWMEAQGYSTHPDDCDGMAEAFTAGMQAARDLIADAASPTAEDFDNAAEIMRLRDTAAELLAAFDFRSHGWNVARLTDEHLERLRKRIEDQPQPAPELAAGEIVYLYHWRFDRGEEFGLYRHAADADAKAAQHADEGLSEVLSMAVLGRPEQPAPDLRALLDHETRLTWESGLPGERARVAGVRESAGLEAL